MGSMKEPAISLYDADYDAWVHGQVDALRRGDLASLDLHHLIGEVESLGRSEERELESRMEQLLMHLLKWQYQPNEQSTSWGGTIREQRRRIEKLFKRMPSLRAKAGEFLQDEYEVARAGLGRDEARYFDVSDRVPLHRGPALRRRLVARRARLSGLDPGPSR